MDTPSVAASIPFRAVCDLFDKISEAQGGKAKYKKLKRFCDHFRKVYQQQYGGTLDPMKANNDSLFCIIRLLFPHEDQSRPPFGFKAVKLSAQFPKILGLDPGTPDGKLFIHFKDPRTSGSAAGDLSKIVYNFLKDRVSNEPKNPLNLAELHQILDKLGHIFGSSPDTQKDLHLGAKDTGGRAVDRQRPILQNLFRRLSPIEGKWVTRILLRRLDLGMQKSAIFNCLHEKAQELYGRVGNLEAVCVELNDPAATLEENIVVLFRPFNPMLCGRIYSLDTAPLPDSESEVKLPRGGRGRLKNEGAFYLPNPPFLIENKFDGERMQIHFDASKSPHDQFRYYTRSRREYSEAYVNIYSPKLRGQIHPKCQSFILDGEMMVWSLETQHYVQKALGPDLRRSWADHPDLQPTFVVFDLVYFNGENLENLPLEERMDILAKKKLVLEPKEGVIVLSEQQLVEENGSECVRRALHEAVEKCEEGLIVKDCRSKYAIGKRGQAWVKIKPEFFPEHSNSDLDVIILGGYFTKSQSRGGIITSFLVGVLNDQPGGARGSPNNSEPKFYALAKVGPGHLKNPELFKLVEELRPNFVPKSKLPSPPEKHIKFDSRPRPDFYIEPQKSLVVTVRASQIILATDRGRGGVAQSSENSSKGLLAEKSPSASYSLNFCRIFCVQRNKSWRDILTLGQVHELYESNKSGRLTKRGDYEEEDEDNEFEAMSDSPHDDDLASSPSSSRMADTVGSTKSPADRSLRPSSSSPKTPPLEEKAAGTWPELKKFTVPAGGYKSKFQNSPSLSPTSVSPKNVEIVSQSLDGRVFMVIGSTEFVSRVTMDILSHGGEVVQNRTRDLFAIVAEKVSPKVERLMATAGDHHIVKETWLQKSIMAGAPIIDPIESEDNWRVEDDGPKAEKYGRHDEDDDDDKKVAMKDGQSHKKKTKPVRVLFDDSEEEERGS